MTSRRSRAGVLAILLALAGCAAGPEIDLVPASAPATARDGLVRLAGEGPVPLEVRGILPLMTFEEAAKAIEDGVRALDFSLAPDTTGTGTRVVLDMSGSKAPVCGPVADGGPTDIVKLAWCEDDRPVAVAVASLDEREGAAARRLVVRMSRRLFPDDYEESYGFGLFGGGRVGGGLSVGVGGSIGF